MDLSKMKFGAEVETDDHVVLFATDEAGSVVELVYWDRQEWIDDPSVVTAIANALIIGYTQGVAALLEQCPALGLALNEVW